MKQNKRQTKRPLPNSRLKSLENSLNINTRWIALEKNQIAEIKSVMTLTQVANGKEMTVTMSGLATKTESHATDKEPSFSAEVKHGKQLRKFDDKDRFLVWLLRRIETAGRFKELSHKRDTLVKMLELTDSL